MDILLGYFDVAEVCKLVGTFILNKLKNAFQNNTFALFITYLLYRDDILAVMKGLRGLEIEKLKKDIFKPSRFASKVLQLKLIYTHSPILM